MDSNKHQQNGSEKGTYKVKRGLAQMLKGGVIMDVVTPEQAKIAEDAGAVAVMALERVPADIRVQGGVARMSDPDMIEGIIHAVSIPVMAKARIGHFVEAQILEALGVDYIDESEVLTPADEEHHINKWHFEVPFVCGCRNLGEALRRINEGAAMMRTKGEAGTGDVVLQRPTDFGSRQPQSGRSDGRHPCLPRAGYPGQTRLVNLRPLPLAEAWAGGIAFLGVLCASAVSSVWMRLPCPVNDKMLIVLAVHVMVSQINPEAADASQDVLCLARLYS